MTWHELLLALAVVVIAVLTWGFRGQRRAAEAERARLAALLDAMEAGIVLYDADDRLVLANADFRRLYPTLAATLHPGQRFEDLLRITVDAGEVPAAIGREAAWVAERVAQRRSLRDGTQVFERRMVDGHWRRVFDQRLPDGSLLGFSIDVTELVEQREALRILQAQAQAARDALDDALDALPDGFALFDADDRLVAANRRYREVYPDSAPAIVLGATFESIVRYGLERGQYPQAEGDREAWLAERLRRHRAADGVPILQQVVGDRWLQIDERRTRAGGIAGVRTDVTELVRTREALEHANAELSRLSSTDALTGALNRRGFDEHLAAEHRRALRHATPLALLLVDVDHFKRYNDRHGHPAGDAVLQRIAGVLSQQARRPGERVARYGGEEFALVLPHCGAEGAALVARRCLDAMAQAAVPHGDSPLGALVTLSIGVAMAREAGSAAELLARADAELYRAKQGGRARACVEAEALP
ncbi:MAG TPA: diguanylate cyclase [Burkholderiaceae bacterium]|nr:diguanylate cyclase [Burkholderiaceae bacterium]